MFPPKETIMFNKMTVKEIIIQYLEEHGFDGLCFPGMRCNCYLDHDFMPCENPEIDECKPGYKHIKDDGDWEITPEKPEAE